MVPGQLSLQSGLHSPFIYVLSRFDLDVSSLVCSAITHIGMWRKTRRQEEDVRSGVACLITRGEVVSPGCGSDCLWASLLCAQTSRLGPWAAGGRQDRPFARRRPDPDAPTGPGAPRLPTCPSSLRESWEGRSLPIRGTRHPDRTLTGVRRQLLRVCGLAVRRGTLKKIH